MTFIDNIRDFPKMWSVWFGAISGLFSALEFLNALGYVLPLFETRFEPGMFALIGAACALAGVIARAIKQFYPEVGDGEAKEVN